MRLSARVRFHASLFFFGEENEAFIWLHTAACAHRLECVHVCLHVCYRPLLTPHCIDKENTSACVCVCEKDYSVDYRLLSSVADWICNVSV